MTLAFSLPPSTPSVLSRLDPRWKLAALLIVAAVVATLHTLPAAAIALAESLLLALLARLPSRWFLDRLGMAVVFLALFILPLPWFLTGDGAVWTFGPLRLSWHGVEVALLLAAKAIALLTLFLTAQATAPLEDTLKAAHALRIPGLLVQLGLLTYRYVFVLADELRRLRLALRVRGYRNRVSRHSYRTAGHIAGTLLVRGSERAERVGQAMRCRGFDGQFRSLKAFTTRRTDVAAFLLIAASAAALAFWDWLPRFSGVIDVSADLAIDVRDLSFAYPDGAPALAGLSFAVAAGESVGLVGPNGAGKTSLFLCLSGVLKARAALLQVGSIDVRDAAQRKRLPTQVGIVFQNSDDQLFNATVFDDVAFGPLNLDLPPDEVRKRVAEALERVGLAGMEERVPFHLSGGEKRRVALAGVLAMQPSILLLDEPSMYLDPRGRRELIQLLHKLGGTRMIASHDLELILQTCDRVLLLDRGRLMADGPVRTILADAALMETHGLEVPYSLRGAASLDTSPPTKLE